MTRMIAVIWLGAVAAMAWGLFQVKNEVRSLEAELHKTHWATKSDRETIEILKAEWSYLNQPARIADLATRHLALAPLDNSRIVEVSELSSRLSPQFDGQGTPTGPSPGPSPDLPLAQAATLASAEAER